MPRTILTDTYWTKLKPMLLELNIYDKPSLRNTVEGILFRLRTGCPWRDIHEYFGKPNTIYKTFQRWSQHNKLMTLFQNLVINPDLEWIFIDGSHVRAHQHSSGANQQEQAISKSIGGNSSKIHLAVDSNGNYISFIVSDGTTHDVKVAPDLINSLDLTETDILSADRGYDSEKIRLQIIQKNTRANIPRKRNSRMSNDHMDWYLYKIRHLVENAFAQLKQFRAIATRFDKLKNHFENTIALVCAFTWLKL